ncbi:MAG TPA: hypothetical protein VHV77_17020 [Pirellulales bacterium]|nr:hypothetical protein [Pirellulales bacterium]
MGHKNWLFYRTDTHAEAAIFSIVATCRLHGVDLFVYFDEVYASCPSGRIIATSNLAPPNWLATHARLGPDRLALPIAAIIVPPSHGE